MPLLGHRGHDVLDRRARGDLVGGGGHRMLDGQRLLRQPRRPIDQSQIVLVQQADHVSTMHHEEVSHTSGLHAPLRLVEGLLLSDRRGLAHVVGNGSKRGHGVSWR